MSIYDNFLTKTLESESENLLILVELAFVMNAQTDRVQYGICF